MIRKKLQFLSIILLILFLITNGITIIFATEKPIELKLSVYDNPTGLAGYHFKQMKEQIEKSTNGKVKVEIFWSSSLLKGPEMLRGVADGVSDMAQINPNYYPNQMPLNSVFVIIPAGPNTYQYKTHIFKTALENISEMKKEFTSNNQIPLYTWVSLPKLATSTKPIESLQDFKGLKMRAGGRWLLEMLGGTGATPISVPWSDCYMALQTGTIDAVVTNLDGIHNTKLDEVGKHIYVCPQIWNSCAFYLSINTDRWNSMPKDIQGQIKDALNEVSRLYAEEFDEDWNRILEEQKEMGCIINKMTPEDAERWANLPIKKEIEVKWIKEAEERGLINAKEILEQVKEIVEEGIRLERSAQ